MVLYISITYIYEKMILVGGGLEIISSNIIINDVVKN